MPSLIKKIVITGGPCAGKTTAMSWIDANFKNKGYTVLFVPEAATELISGGVAPWTCGTNLEFQKIVVRTQRFKEAMFRQAADTMAADKVLLVCDRGTLDNKAYMSGDDFLAVQRDLGLSEIALRDEYDAVFHLVTAANGAAEFYTLSNNAARIETPEQAIELDNKIIAAWTGHPHMRVIENKVEFEQKLERLMAEIYAFLGEEGPLDIKKRLLIRYPPLDEMEAMPSVRKVEISQTYLATGTPDLQVRVRQRGEGGMYVFTRTETRFMPGGRRVETERRLTEREYLNALMQADPRLRPIRKTRYCILYKNQSFKLDIFPFWRDRAMLEIELNHEEERLELPPFTRVIKDVTSDERYSNHSLARVIIDE